jgi:hypothetical protein
MAVSDCIKIKLSIINMYFAISSFLKNNLFYPSKFWTITEDRTYMEEVQRNSEHILWLPRQCCRKEIPTSWLEK